MELSKEEKELILKALKFCRTDITFSGKIGDIDKLRDRLEKEKVNG